MSSSSPSLSLSLTHSCSSWDAFLLHNLATNRWIFHSTFLVPLCFWKRQKVHKFNSGGVGEEAKKNRREKKILGVSRQREEKKICILATKALRDCCEKGSAKISHWKMNTFLFIPISLFHSLYIFICIYIYESNTTTIKLEIWEMEEKAKDERKCDKSRSIKSVYVCENLLE